MKFDTSFQYSKGYQVPLCSLFVIPRLSVFSVRLSVYCIRAATPQSKIWSISLCFSCVQVALFIGLTLVHCLDSLHLVLGLDCSCSGSLSGFIKWMSSVSGHSYATVLFYLNHACLLIDL